MDLFISKKNGFYRWFDHHYMPFTAALVGLLIGVYFVVSLLVVMIGPAPFSKEFAYVSSFILSEAEMKPFLEDHVLSLVEVSDIQCMISRKINRSDQFNCWMSAHWPTKHSIDIQFGFK